MLQRPLHFAVVDEVDSVLIDECRNPFILNMPDDSTDLAPAWRAALEIANRLEAPSRRSLPASFYQGEPLVEPLPFDFSADPRDKTTTLTQRGMRNTVRHLEALGLVALAVEPGSGELHVALLASRGHQGPVEMRVQAAQHSAR